MLFRSRITRKYYFSRVMIKPFLGICENKVADQSFVLDTNIVQSLYSINLKLKPPAIFCAFTARFVPDLIGEDRASRDAVQFAGSLGIITQTSPCNITAVKNGKFQMKKMWHFPYFCSKHSSWIHVRTASLRRFKPAPMIYDLEQSKKIMHTLVNPSFPI